jgi:DNA repair exonuclease SbcCD ATPase subunit
MNGILLENTTGLHLMGGPITVFEEDSYAGDALIEDIRPSGERLLSFSLDLDTTVMAEEQAVPEEISRVRIYRGSLITSRLQRRSSSYTAINTAAKQKELLIIHPRTSGWELREPAAADEVNDQSYRFRLTLPPSQSGRKLAVIEERTVDQSIALRNLGGDTIQFYLRQQNLSPAVKQALQRVQELSASAAEARRERERLETEIRDIHRGQERIRANMAELDRDSALYRRYIATLTDQEDELAELNKALVEARSLESSRQNDLDRYIGALEVD